MKATATERRSERRTGSDSKGWVKALVGALGVMTLVLGMWALLAPLSFFDRIALFPPYNEHLLHDVGAFQAGIGVMMLVALKWRDGIVVALAGFTASAVLHTVSHAIDTHLGGRWTDPFAVGLLAVVAGAALVVHARRQGEQR